MPSSREAEVDESSEQADEIFGMYGNPDFLQCLSPLHPGSRSPQFFQAPHSPFSFFHNEGSTNHVSESFENLNPSMSDFYATCRESESVDLSLDENSTEQSLLSNSSESLLTISHEARPNLLSRLAEIVDGSSHSIVSSKNLLPSYVVNTPFLTPEEAKKFEFLKTGSFQGVRKEIGNMNLPILITSRFKDACGNLSTPMPQDMDQPFDKLPKSEDFNRPSSSQTLERIEDANNSSLTELRKHDVLLMEWLYALAEAIATDDQQSCRYRLSFLQKEMDSNGSAIQRLTYYVVEALLARRRGNGLQLWKKPLCAKQSDMDEALGYLAARIPFAECGMTACAGAIVDSCREASAIHVVEFGDFPAKWPILMQQLALLPGGPPSLRITSVETPTAGLKRSRLEVSEGLRAAALQLKIVFEHRWVKCRMEEFEVAMVEVRPGEALAVHCELKLHQLPDHSVLRHSPRDLLIEKIREMSPQVVTVFEQEADFNGPFFLQRVRNVLSFYRAAFRLFEECASCQPGRRATFERDLVARDIVNVLACEGTQRIVRAEVFAKWRPRFHRACFVALPFSARVLDSVQRVLDRFPPAFQALVQGGCLTLLYRAAAFFSVSVWRPLPELA